MGNKVTPTWLDELNDATRDVLHISFVLDDLSSSFFHTGNQIMGEDLKDYAERLKTATTAIMGAVSKSINDSYRQAQENTGTILKACLAGAELERRKGGVN